MNRNRILFLGSQDVRALLPMRDCIDAVEHAFRVHGEGKAADPVTVGVHTQDGGFHIKAGMLARAQNYFAAKVNGNFPGNPVQYGLPTIQGLIVLFDAENGSPLAIMDSREITALRTGAATGVAAKYLARQNSEAITLCGCGIQARFQIAALSHIVPCRMVFAFDKNQDQAASLSASIERDHGISATPVADLRMAILKSDICVTSTPSRKALVHAEDVRPGTFIAAVGADNPSKQELTPELMAAGKIVCDVVDQCAAIGDLHHALDAGVIRQSDVFAELGEIVAGKKPGRESDEEVTIFDSTGMALQDVAAAALVFERAKESGFGTELEIAS